MTQESNKQPKDSPPPKRRVLLSAAECASKEEFKKRAKAALREAGILRDEKPQ